MTASDASDVLAAAAEELAHRFEAGGTLWCVAPDEPSHARHAALEFLHPVVVGARALPAVAAGVDGRPAADDVAAFARAGDAVLAVGPDAAAVDGALAPARRVGAATIALTGDGRGAAEHVVALGDLTDEPGDPDPVLAYHLLWELVHVVLAHSPGGEGPGAGSKAGGDPDPTAFLYPFLGDDAPDRAALRADLSASARAKAAESAALAARTVAGAAGAIDVIGDAVAAAAGRGGRVHVFGNGGSATDADRLAAALRPFVAARSLADDASIVTALANDVGIDVVFARQIDAVAFDGDVAIALSTSGASRDIVDGLRAARARRLRTVALVGADGSPAAGVADVALTVASDSVHRVQEAHGALIRALVRAVASRIGRTEP